MTNNRCCCLLTAFRYVAWSVNTRSVLDFNLLDHVLVQYQTGSIDLCGLSLDVIEFIVSFHIQSNGEEIT